MDTAFGVFMGLLLGFFLVMAASTSSTGMTHNVGWKHQVCVWTTDRSEVGVQTKTEHCVTGEDLAKWAKEHGR